MKKLIILFLLAFTFVNAQIELDGGIKKVPSLWKLSGTNIVPVSSWSLLPSANGVGNLGASGTIWNLIYGDSLIGNSAELTTWLKLPVTNASGVGVVYKATDTFLHDYKPSANDGRNLFIGVSSGNFTMASGVATQSSDNVGIGYYTLNKLTTGFSNTAIGSNSMSVSTTAHSNVGIGYGALQSNTIGHDNVAVGSLAMLYNTEGSYNTAIGEGALVNNLTTGYNSAFGFQALNNNKGIDNTAMGSWAMYYNTNGNSNTGIGSYSLQNTTGSFNTAIGRESGYDITTGTYNVFIGYQSGEAAPGAQKVDATNSIAIGYGAYTTASNQVVLGNTSITQTILRGSVLVGGNLTLNNGATPTGITLYSKDATGTNDRYTSIGWGSGADSLKYSIAQTYNGGSAQGAMYLSGFSSYTFDNLTIESTTAGITASTTQSQGQLPLTKNINEVAVVGNANDVVTMPTAVAGLRITIINNGANTLQIFPASGDNLGAGVDTSVTLAAGSNVTFVAYDGTNWEQL